MTVAEVFLWGSRVGAVLLEDGAVDAIFRYDPVFLPSGIELSPFVMPLGGAPYQFPAISRGTFRGLPGLLADSLPDKYGTDLVDDWLLRHGRDPASFDVVERLCYVGNRGMGALEYRPALGPTPDVSEELNVSALVELAQEVMEKRHLDLSFEDAEREHVFVQLIQVGSSPGGARPKAVIAWNPKTNAVRSGQMLAPPGFEYWLLKFDDVETPGRDSSVTYSDGALEYAYWLMATTAGVQMSESRILEDGQARHFMTKRFDRTDDGDKVHVQSLCALKHLDFQQLGAYGYELVLTTTRDLGLGTADVEQQFRRAVFNVAVRNHDDHVKNVAYLMNRDGEWSISPAYDITYSFDRNGRYTKVHQMSLNGKRENFTTDDFTALAEVGRISKKRAMDILGEVREIVGRWREFAEQAGLSEDKAAMIEKDLLP